VPPETAVDFPLQLSFKIIALAPQLSVTDAGGRTVGYVQQKLFKLREAVTVYSDASRSQTAYTIEADRILDFSAEYRFTNAAGQSVGAVKRQGLRSLWRARYAVLDGAQEEFTIEEENPWVKMADGLFEEIPLVGMLSGYVFHPAYSVKRGETVVARMQKQAALWEGRYRIEALQTLTPEEQERVTLSLLMLVLLERSRG
jgi:uncharacterized protein YxjI